jgi:hypothetical protein
MCIAILNPADGAELSRRQIRNCYHHNPDGCGMAWAYKGKLYTWRSVNSGYRSFIKQYRAVRSLEVPVVAHFRLATHGRRDEDNCHPFLVKDGQMAVVHNGIITQADKVWGGKENSHKSDTWLFCENILESLPERWWDDEGLLALVSDYVSGSKLVILPTDGRWVIINPGLGDWEKDGNWYSNSTHSYASRGSYYGGYNGWDDWGYGSYTGGRKTYTNGHSAKTARNPAVRDPETKLIWDGDECVGMTDGHDFEIWDPKTHDWEKTDSLWTPREEDEDLGPDLVDGAYMIEGCIVCELCIDGFGEDAWHAEEVYNTPGEAIRCDI